MYFAYPESHKDFHEGILDSYMEAAELLGRNQSSNREDILPLTFKMIDLDKNDLPSVYGEVPRPILAMYTANDKDKPRFMKEMNDGELTVCHCSTSCPCNEPL